MSAGFTPGPWRVAQHTKKISVYADAIDRPHKKSPNRGGLVAATPVEQGSAQADRALADAALIAAAPELFEALAEARLIVANLPHDESLFLAKIDAALAKARGEA